MAWVREGDKVFAIAVVAYMSLAIYLLMLCFSLTSQAKRQSLKQLVHGFRCKGRKADARERDIQTKTCELIARERVRCVRSYASPFMHFYALLTLLSVISLEGMATKFTLHSTPDLILHFAVCMLFVVSPGLVGARTINATYIALSAWWAVGWLLLMDPNDMSSALPINLLQRTVMGILTCNGLVTATCNTGILVAHLVALQKVGYYVTHDDGLYRAAFADVIGTALLIFVLTFFEHCIWRAFRCLLEVNRSSKTEMTVLRLLSALCDAVVTLGDDLRISTPAPKLANLLLQGCSMQGLEGSDFLDFMVETDRVRFRQFLAQEPDWADSSNDPAPAQALNVHLRDTRGKGVQCQLLHSHFQDLGGEVMHLIGICEIGDAGGRRLDSVGTTHTRANHGAPERHMHMMGGVASNDSASTTRGSIWNDSEASLAGDSASVVAARSHETEMLGRASAGPARGRPPHREVSINFQTLQFAIRGQQSNAPIIDASLLERENLQQWVLEWVSTRMWVQDFIIAALRPVQADKWPSRAGPPSALSFRVSLRGTCALPSDLLSRTSTAADTPEVCTLLATSAAAASAAAAERDGRLRFAVGRLRLSRRRLLDPTPSVSGSALNVGPVSEQGRLRTSLRSERRGRGQVSEARSSLFGGSHNTDPAGTQRVLFPAEEETTASTQESILHNAQSQFRLVQEDAGARGFMDTEEAWTSVCPAVLGLSSSHRRSSTRVAL